MNWYNLEFVLFDFRMWRSYDSSPLFYLADEIITSQLFSQLIEKPSRALGIR
jgi:hypothetical protein